MNRSWIRLSLCFALLIPAIAGRSIAENPPDCDRIVAVGDLHGGYDQAVTILTTAELIDENLDWIGVDACFVQTGDVPDRGAESRRIFDLLMRLESQAPEQVFPLKGNHEVMNIVGDLRYVHPGEFAAFADEETEDERERGFKAFVAAKTAAGADGTIPDAATLREPFDEAYPPGWFAHRRAFSPEGKYGAWLSGNAIIAKVGRWVFLHGGLTVEDARLGVSKLNARAAQEIADYLRLRDELVERGVIGPLESYKQAWLTVEAALNRRKGDRLPRLDKPSRKAAKDFLELRTASVFRSTGPLWNRDFEKSDEAMHSRAIGQVLKRIDADHIAVSHSVQKDGKIRDRWEGRVFLIDTGAGPHYGGHVSALEIHRSRLVQALYPGETPAVLVGSDDGANAP